MHKMLEPLGYSTRCVHAAETARATGDPIAVPIYQTATYSFEKMEALEAYLRGEKAAYLYTRGENPTQDVASNKIANLEGGEAGCLFSSGMAAITTTILSLCSKGDEIIATTSLYGATFTFFETTLRNFEIQTKFVEPEEVEKIPDLVNENSKLFYFETPTNPTLRIVDMNTAITLAKENNLKVMIDNTFATPVNQTPIESGADIVVHSATKYLAGHGDLVAGAAVGDKPTITEIIQVLKTFGGILDPFGAYLLIRGLKTLALRVERQNTNAMHVAQFLQEHPKVKAVHYPGLEMHPQYNIARKQMKGFGGMLCMELDASLKETCQVLEAFQLLFRGASLGDVQSLASIPVLTSHYYLTEEELKIAGVKPEMIRISVGIEDAEDLISDFEQALSVL